jgi:uncharacterized membrane protein
MVEDANTAQARELLHSLYAHVDEISQMLEAAEQKRQAVRGRVEGVVRRHAASLRQELYEAHRLIDGIHGRFPGTRPPRRWESHTARPSGVPERPTC